ncbi:ParM/StbA family protein [Phormidium nigroviride]
MYPPHQIVVDAGSSETKIEFWVAGATAPDYAMMLPEVKQIPTSRLEKYLSGKGVQGCPAIEDQTYIEVKGSTFVFGSLAREFSPKDRITELKSDTVSYKAAAAIGVMAERYNLKSSDSKRLKINLKVLLPCNEYEARSRTEQKFRELIADYKFCGTPIYLELTGFECVPEGAGLAMIRMKQKGMPWFRQHKLAVLMFGYRNTTALVYERGIRKVSDSPLYGFSQFLNKIIDQTSGLNQSILMAAFERALQEQFSETEEVQVRRSVHDPIDKTLSPVKPIELRDAIQQLARSKDADMRIGEINSIISAISTAKADYWEIVADWLDNKLPSDLDEVFVSGGASLFFISELENYFNCQPEVEVVEQGPYRFKLRKTGKYLAADSEQFFTPIVWNAEVLPDVEKAFNLGGESFERTVAAVRLTDAFGMLAYMNGKAKEDWEKQGKPKRLVGLKSTLSEGSNQVAASDGANQLASNGSGKSVASNGSNQLAFDDSNQLAFDGSNQPAASNGSGKSAASFDSKQLMEVRGY